MLPLKLIVGLGNPGDRYLQSRHNFGFMVLENLARENNIPVSERRFDSLMGRGILEGTPVILAKPQTFMNLSGISLEKLVGYFKVPCEDVIVLHDDLDIALGDIRIKQGGGDGGHKGVMSIIDHLGGAEFIRVRLGIGRPPADDMVESYVLKHFSAAEKAVVPGVITRATQAVLEIIASGAQAAMNRFNVRITNNSGKEV